MTNPQVVVKMTDGSLAHLLEHASTLVLDSVSNRFRIHSVYCYNLSKIDVSEPVYYRLQNVRDGRNFSIRFVEISQGNKPAQIFEYSLQNIASIDVSVTYTPKFPDVALPNTMNNMNKPLNNSSFYHYCKVESKANVSAYWIKLDDSKRFNHENIPLLMFSDYGIIAEDFEPITEHSVWIHGNGFHRGDCLLLELEEKSEKSKKSVKGKIWSQGGMLLLSFIQERKTSTSKI